MTLLVLVLNAVFFFVLAFWVRKKVTATLRPVFWTALIYKLCAGIGMGLVYRYYYSTGDTFYLFDLAGEQARLFYHEPAAYFDFLRLDANEEWKGASRSIFFVKLTSIVVIITDRNYWMTSCWFSFLSFVCALSLVNQIVRFFPEGKLPAIFAFLFFPSVAFWGSGIIKECIALAALLLLSGIFLKAMMNDRVAWWELILSLVCVLIVWNLKYYWIAVFLPLAATSLIVNLTSVRLGVPAHLRLVYWLALFVVLCFGASLTHPNFYIERFLAVVVENHDAFVAVSEPSDLIFFDSLHSSWSSVIINSPMALVAGLFRPFIWEANTGLKLIVSIENLLVLILCVGTFFRLKGFFDSQKSLIALSLITYIALLSIFLALSTPNMGSLARYKVGFLPFLIFLISYRNPLINYLLSLGRRWGFLGV